MPLHQPTYTSAPTHSINSPYKRKPKSWCSEAGRAPGEYLVGAPGLRREHLRHPCPLIFQSLLPYLQAQVLFCSPRRPPACGLLPIPTGLL